MAGRIGMDPGVVRNLAGQLDHVAQSLDALIGSVESIVNSVAGQWYGADASAFHDDWNGQHRPSLSALVQDVRTMAGAARTNATEQDQASQVGSGGGGPGAVIAGGGRDTGADRVLGDLDPWMFGAAGAGAMLSGTALLAKDGLGALSKVSAPLSKVDKYAGPVGAVAGTAYDAVTFGHDLATEGVGTDVYNDQLNLVLDGAAIVMMAVPPLEVAGFALGAASFGISALEHSRFRNVTAAPFKAIDTASEDVAGGAISAGKKASHLVSGGVHALSHLF
jgi:WXG100 family type VII secretion target